MENTGKNLVETFSPEHPLWKNYLSHLEEVDMLRWIVDAAGRPPPDFHFLGAIHGNNVVGNISLKVQEIQMPATAWSEGRDHTLKGPAGIMSETFVQTFAVAPRYRRQGFGHALQEAALELTQQLGCYQMRSWSSLDKPGNYALKIGLNFVAHPAIQKTSSGLCVSGVYFIKKV
jgi:GNAT superfamily N-acetyltransferase